MMPPDAAPHVPLAHSPRPARGIPPQTYVEHVEMVRGGAMRRADNAATFSPPYGEILRAIVAAAAEFHDLGKLDDANQKSLRSGRRDKLPVRHEDAGAAHFLQSPAPGKLDELAALLIYSHHHGLQSLFEEKARGGHCFRINQGEGYSLKQPLFERTNSRLDSYRQVHRRLITELTPTIPAPTVDRCSQLLCRIALSCLVDADHSDTARHYGNPPPADIPPLRPAERLTSLDDFVEQLASGKADERTRSRREVYRACRDADTGPSLLECDSPVGTGKTTAVMAHLLQAALAKDLRRLFIVLPFTNIIDQSVGVYRRAIVLPGEDPEAVVAAVHHKAEYQAPDSRHLAALWEAPIVVTTAVQFFETLAAASTAGLRKLHNLVGSGVFLDESHAALPAKLWPTAWHWIRQLVDEWGAHFVMGSGSLNRIWEIRQIEDEPLTLPPLVRADVRRETDDAEARRIRIRERPDPLTLDTLIAWLDELPGPRLLIVNTVQIAAALARGLAERRGADSVMHLSNALTPHHRAIMLDRVKSRLVDRRGDDWTLVATSCVEAGVDFSFRSGLRQRASLMSLLQATGRVNRNNEYQDAEVWDFQLVPGGLVNTHPAFKDSAEILGKLFKKKRACNERLSPDDCTDALRQEILETRKDSLNQNLDDAEDGLDFPKVEKLFRVIDADTGTVVVSKTLSEAIEKGEPIDWRELQKHSVQLYTTNIETLGLREAPALRGVYFWDYQYDDLLGYMAGLLPLLDGGWQNGFF